MQGNSFKRFFISIVMPTILAIGLFIVVIFVFILPHFERSIMDGKKEMISELTHTVSSLIEEYELEAARGLLSVDSAKALAAERIEQIRYGKELKDYFWIIDQQPVMVMHPYRPGLNGKNLNDYKDPEGKLLFVESVKLVREHGEGFIDYRWQWKDDSTRIVPKLSYVKAIPEWNWVVGTGIYLEDVRMEIRGLKGRLLSIALIITLVIVVILGFIIRSSLGIENRRRKAEADLRLSREKYKSLVDASTEGTLMLVDGEFIFSNSKFSLLSGYDQGDIRTMDPLVLFQLEQKDLDSAFEDPKKSMSWESTLRCKDGSSKEVVVSISRINYSGETGYILIVKEVSVTKKFEKESSMLSGELQASLSLMNQPLHLFSKPLKICPSDASIREAADIMTRKQRDALLLSLGDQVLGIINNNDLNNRVLSAGVDPGTQVMKVMSSPVVSLSENALLHEGILLMRNKGISHLVLSGGDMEYKGIISYKEIAGMQQNTVDYLIREVEAAEEVEQIAKVYRRLPVLIKALIESGSNTGILTRIISSLADAIHRRVIELALEEKGSPPCGFAFMVMGSLGRSEQTLATDQDNAIILERSKDGLTNEEQEYFLSLGKKLNQDLHKIGYRLCEGDVMAGNPKWNHDLETWKGYIGEWIVHGEPKDILDAAIFFDFRCIYGNEKLVSELRDFVNETSSKISVFFFHMARSVINIKIPRSREQVLELKKLLFPITAFLRLYAIRHQLEQCGSMERAHRLMEMRIIDKVSHEDLNLAFNELTRMRLKSQVASIFANEVPGNSIAAESLNQVEQMTLKKLHSIIASLQTRLSSEYSGADQ